MPNVITIWAAIQEIGRDDHVRGYYHSERAARLKGRCKTIPFTARPSDDGSTCTILREGETVVMNDRKPRWTSLPLPLVLASVLALAIKPVIPG